MFRDVPECSGMFHVLGFIDAHFGDRLLYGTKFLQVRIFAIFSERRKNQFPQIKITARIFPTKIYSRVNILYYKFATQNTVLRNRFCSISSGFFRVETKRYTMKYWFQFTSGTHTVVLFENMFFYCTFSIKTKISSILGTAYFLKTNLS